jgi:hypothetical protein
MKNKKIIIKSKDGVLLKLENLIVSNLPDDNKKVSIIKALRYIEKKYPIIIKIDN